MCQAWPTHQHLSVRPTSCEVPLSITLHYAGDKSKRRCSAHTHTHTHTHARTHARKHTPFPYLYPKRFSLIHNPSMFPVTVLCVSSSSLLWLQSYCQVANLSSSLHSAATRCVCCRRGQTPGWMGANRQPPTPAACAQNTVADNSSDRDGRQINVIFRPRVNKREFIFWSRAKGSREVCLWVCVCVCVCVCENVCVVRLCTVCVVN